MEEHHRLRQGCEKVEHRVERQPLHRPPFAAIVGPNAFGEGPTIEALCHEVIHKAFIGEGDGPCAEEAHHVRVGELREHARLVLELMGLVRTAEKRRKEEREQDRQGRHAKAIIIVTRNELHLRSRDAVVGASMHWRER